MVVTATWGLEPDMPQQQPAAASAMRLSVMRVPSNGPQHGSPANHIQHIEAEVG